VSCVLSELAIPTFSNFHHKAQSPTNNYDPHKDKAFELILENVKVTKTKCVPHKAEVFYFHFSQIHTTKN
jgi:hypothetical protein